MKNSARQRLERSRALVCVVDVQEKLVPLMSSQERWVSRIKTLVTAARALEIPVLATEQNSPRLGGSVPEAGLLAEDPCFEKMSFSCYAESGFVEVLRDSERDQVVLCGIETHICVQATALDLLRAGYEVFVAADATATRLAHTMPLGLARMEAAGAVLGSVEGFLFECLDRCDQAEFKAVLALVKESL